MKPPETWSVESDPTDADLAVVADGVLRSGRAEAAGRERGARDALIEILRDRTAALYVREGYTTLSPIDAYVGPFTKHVLWKDL